MYSQCPECQTRFRVTAAALRAAHGTVRCGRCGSAFDALQRLSDTLPEDVEATPSMRTLAPALAAFDAPGRTTGPRDGADVGVPRLGDETEDDAASEFHFSADDIERVFIDARDWQKRFPTRDPGGGEYPHTVTPSQGASPAHGRRAEDHERAAEVEAGEGIGDFGAPVVFVHEPEAVEDITLEGERVVVEGLPELDDDLREILQEAEASDDALPLPERAALPHDPDSTDRFEVLRSAPEAAVVEAVTESARERATGAEDPLDVVVGLDAPDRTAELDEAVTARPGEPAPSSLPPIVPFRLRQREFPVEAEPDGEQYDAAARPRRRGALWAAGALVLAVALAAQVVHHFRQDLARDASVGALVRSAYARIGRPLAPNWDLAAFELRQWGASESGPTAPGTLAVRASLRNGAAFAQPLPLLRLELEDRFGDTVARRDFEPREYLNDPAQASRMLASGATTEAALTVIDEGTDAVGYRLDVCMRDDAAVTHCAQSRTHDRTAASP